MNIDINSLYIIVLAVIVVLALGFFTWDAVTRKDDSCDEHVRPFGISTKDWFSEEEKKAYRKRMSEIIVKGYEDER